MLFQKPPWRLYSPADGGRRLLKVEQESVFDAVGGFICADVRPGD